MTVSMQLTKRIYAGNGLTRNWEVDFPLASTEDIRVFVTSPLGEETEITSNFELNTSGNVLTYPTIESELDLLPGGWTLTLVRQTPLTQEIDLLRQGEFDAEVLEQGYDKLTMIVQELSEKIDRSIKYPVSTQTADLETDTFLNTILAAKQAAADASTQAAASAQTASTSAANAAQTATNAISSIETASQTAQSTLTAQAETLSASLAQSVSTAQEAVQTAQYYAQHSLGKVLGEVYFSASSSAADNPGGLPLFTGETISNADQLYPDFYDWVADHSELQISAANYETAIATYGECPKYVIDTTNKTIRLPKLVNYLKMANTTGKITQSAAGLPNIIGTVSNSGQVGAFEGGPTGAFTGTTSSKNPISTGSGTYSLIKELGFDASKSSSVYGNSTTVTPAHTTLFPWVCAYNTAVPASTAQAAEFQAALSSKVDTDLSNLSPSTVVDGQWVYSQTTLAQSATITAQTAYSYSLASYLPNDSHVYEVIIALNAHTAATNGDIMQLGLGTDIINTQNGRMFCVRSQASSTQYGGGLCNMPVGTGRTVTIKQLSTPDVTVDALRILAYRRVGTNA